MWPIEIVKLLICNNVSCWYQSMICPRIILFVKKYKHSILVLTHQHLESSRAHIFWFSMVFVRSSDGCWTTDQSPLHSSIYQDGGGCGWLGGSYKHTGKVNFRHITTDRLQHHWNIQQINILCHFTVSTVLVETWDLKKHLFLRLHGIQCILGDTAPLSCEHSWRAKSDDCEWFLGQYLDLWPLLPS